MPRIHRPPCRLLRLWAGFLFSQKTYKTLFEPLFAEFDEEYRSALAAGCKCKAGMIRFRTCWKFWLAAFAQLPVSLLRILYEIWKNTKH